MRRPRAGGRSAALTISLHGRTCLEAESPKGASSTPSRASSGTAGALFLNARMEATTQARLTRCNAPVLARSRCRRQESRLPSPRAPARQVDDDLGPAIAQINWRDRRSNNISGGSHSTQRAPAADRASAGPGTQEEQRRRVDAAGILPARLAASKALACCFPRVVPGAGLPPQLRRSRRAAEQKRRRTTDGRPRRHQSGTRMRCRQRRRRPWSPAAGTLHRLVPGPSPRTLGPSALVLRVLRIHRRPPTPTHAHHPRPPPTPRARPLPARCPPTRLATIPDSGARPRRPPSPETPFSPGTRPRKGCSVGGWQRWRRTD